MERKHGINTGINTRQDGRCEAMKGRNFLRPGMEWFAVFYFTDDASDLYFLEEK